MNDYEILLDTINKEIPVKEVPLLEETQDTAYYYRGTIFIDKDLSTVAKRGFMKNMVITKLQLVISFLKILSKIANKKRLLVSTVQMKQSH